MTDADIKVTIHRIHNGTLPLSTLAEALGYTKADMTLLREVVYASVFNINDRGAVYTLFVMLYALERFEQCLRTNRACYAACADAERFLALYRVEATRDALEKLCER